MIKRKRIAILSTHSFGYIDFLVEKLNKAQGVDLTYVNIDVIPFSYRNKISRITNSLLKLLHFPSLKEKNKTNYIKTLIQNEDLFDQILIIRPDKLERKALVFLRENAIQMSCFLFDGIENFKDQKKILSFFDTVYSYDKADVEKYNFQFLTNYIYDDQIETKEITNLVFNISSFDDRFPFLEKLANYFSQKRISFRFIVKKDRIFEHKNIEISDRYLSISEVKDIIASSLVLVDIQQKNQDGLTFRIFEALGYKKKLITNNQDIVTYDFYNPNNIFVISESNYEIPSSFFEKDFVEINSAILNRYKLDNWIFEVFKVNIKENN
ncbi:hypothetical protein ACFX5D_06190 [Flavobacterium sp. LB3P45]|uniref:Lipopolysaccharide biosynthesis protein n=1 Tax=Flavobacterium fructosi TaxID=3230416 RepID=A0ABW6HKK3_9FLAO